MIKVKHIYKLLLLITSIGFAQKPIGLTDAINLALNNNNQIKNQQLKTDYAKALIQSAVDLPKTNFEADLGQVNSNQSDSRYAVMQSFAFPTVYGRQKKVLNLDYDASLLQGKLKLFEIKKQVTQVFYRYVVMKQKEKILQNTDSLYANFVQRANARFSKGENNLLEKATAEIQKATVVVQLKKLRSEIEIEKLQFQLLLNNDSKLEPFSDNLKVSENQLSVDENPFLKILQQQQQMALAETSLQKSKLLPDLNLGYNNNSFRGIGLDDAARYSSFQFGLGISLFNKSQKAKIKAARISENLADNLYRTQLSNLKIANEKLNFRYNSSSEIVVYFENYTLPNAKKIIDIATKQFANGDINYLSYVQLINQAQASQLDYFDAIMQRNDVIIDLNFLTLQH